MNWIVDNWFLIVVAAALITAACMALKRFFGMPNEEQLSKYKEWLLYAVTQAEAALGNGTGRIKLAMVYDMFVERFGWPARVISFTQFSLLVDEALQQMRHLLETNENIRNYVEGNE